MKTAMGWVCIWAIACPLMGIGCSQPQREGAPNPSEPERRNTAPARTQDEALARVVQTQAFQTKSEEIRQLSSGEVSVMAMVDREDPERVAGRVCWVVGMFENRETHTVRLATYLVDTATGEVFAYKNGEQEAELGDRMPPAKPDAPKTLAPRPKRPARDYLSVQVIVALCDNENQGIAPVPAALGNGQNPKTNLYWGAMYGLRSFFQNSPHWKQHSVKISSPVQRLAHARFEYAPPGRKKVIVDAWAIDGAKMQYALGLFLNSLRSSSADMVVFVGHNGLMDTALPELSNRTSDTPSIILSCQSDSYFRPLIQDHSGPLLVSTFGNMAPEAYSLDAALRAWANGENEPAIRSAAAKAYAKYQRCSLTAAKRLFGQ